jgi:hypothetical protein
MQQISSEALREVETALQRYEAEVRQSGVAKTTEHTYFLHANNFVRWLKGDFTPGRTLR